MSVVKLQTSQKVEFVFPKENEKSVVIFWATWCGPCSVELNRINKAIINNEIDRRFIYAVNMGEDQSVVERDFKNKNYQFESYYNLDNKLASQLKAEVTPTIAFIDNQKRLRWISSGISPTLIYRIKNFL